MQPSGLPDAPPAAAPPAAAPSFDLPPAPAPPMPPPTAAAPAVVASPVPSSNPRASGGWRSSAAPGASTRGAPPPTAHSARGADVGAAYGFNPATGMLENPGGSSGAAETKTRFVESDGPGGFRRVSQVESDAGASRGGAHGGLPGGSSVSAVGAAAVLASRDATMRAAAVAVAAIVAWLGFFAQGLLGGFAMTHLFMTYFLDAANVSEVNADGGFLRYYSPIAVACQRVYVVLTVIALLASVDKYSRDALGGYMLQGFTLRKIEASAVLSFFLAFLLSCVAVPFEDKLYYANVRVPNWWETQSASGSFVSDLKSYHGVNAARCVFALLGWLCACYTVTPGVLDVVERAEAIVRRGDGGITRGGGGGYPPNGGEYNGGAFGRNDGFGGGGDPNVPKPQGGRRRQRAEHATGGFDRGGGGGGERPTFRLPAA